MTKKGMLHFTKSYVDGLRGADFAFLSIDTPVRADDDSDLEPIWRAVEEIAAVAPDGLTVIVTSQVPVGTSNQIAKRLGDRLRVAYVPEFLRLSPPLDTFKNAHRFVIHPDDPEVAASVAAIYVP